MAQATISGSLDYAAFINGKLTVDTGNGTASNTTKTSSTAALNSWTTNQISFQGTEDLGGGLKASFVINTGIAGTSSVGDRDVNLALAGKFGTVRLGRFIPAAAAGFHGFSGAASTAQGSIYGLLASSGAAADRHAPSTNMVAGNFERNNNNVQYTSPNFNGITVNVNYGTNESDKSDVAGESLARQSGLSVSYVAGPLSIGVGTQDRKVQGGITASPIVDNATPIKGDLDWIGASYNFGVATVFATQVKRKDVTTTAGVAATNADIKVNSIGVSVPMGAFTFAASTYNGKDARGSAAADNAKLSGHQVSVRYAMSKRTTVYALMGENKIARDAAAGSANARKATTNMVGVMHTF
jgi:predicted porin